MDTMQTTTFLRLMDSFRKLEGAIHDLKHETVKFIDALEKNKQFLEEEEKKENG